MEVRGDPHLPSTTSPTRTSTRYRVRVRAAQHCPVDVVTATQSAHGQCQKRHGKKG